MDDNSDCNFVNEVPTFNACKSYIVPRSTSVVRQIPWLLSDSAATHH